MSPESCMSNKLGWCKGNPPLRESTIDFADVWYIINIQSLYMILGLWILSYSDFLAIFPISISDLSLTWHEVIWNPEEEELPTDSYILLRRTEGGGEGVGIFAQSLGHLSFLNLTVFTLELPSLVNRLGELQIHIAQHYRNLATRKKNDCITLCTKIYSE